MTDRELLELAAKAAGIEGVYYKGFLDDEWVEGIVYVRDDGQECVWNPLTDDGDAFRLAVRLRIRYEIHPVHPYVAAFAPNVPGRFEEPTDADELHATRRVIVRAAAEIGKGLK